MIGLYHYLALALFASFALVELAAGARHLPPMRGWRLTGIGFFLLYLALGTALPLLCRMSDTSMVGLPVRGTGDEPPCRRRLEGTARWSPP